MAHNINIVNGKASFFSRKEIPWHRLGQVVEDATNSEEAIKLAGLDYEVRKVKLFADLREINPEVKGKELPNYFATVRTDTLDVLGMVGNRYEIVQNSQAFDFVDDIVGSKQAVFETAGALGKGEKIFVTAKLPSNIRIKQTDDIIEKYLLFYGSHDGSSPVIAGLTPVRVVCNNTVNMALKNLSNKITLRHTRNVHEKLEIGRQLMGLYKVYSEEFQQVLNHLANIQITKETIQTAVNSIVLNSEEMRIIAEFGMGDERISTRKKNTIVDMYKYIDQGVGQDLHRGSALWAYNGISAYYSNGKKYKSDEDRFESITDGLANKQTQKMFDTIMALS